MENNFSKAVQKGKEETNAISNLKGTIRKDSNEIYNYRMVAYPDTIKIYDDDSYQANVDEKKEEV